MTRILVTAQVCHSERSEESHALDSSVASLPQNDRMGERLRILLPALLMFSITQSLALQIAEGDSPWREEAQPKTEPQILSVQKKMAQTVNDMAVTEWVLQNCLKMTLPPANRKVLVRFDQDKAPMQDPANSDTLVYAATIVFETLRPRSNGQETAKETNAYESAEKPCLGKDGRQVYLRANALKWKINEESRRPVPKESARLHKMMKQEFEENKKITQKVKP